MKFTRGTITKRRRVSLGLVPALALLALLALASVTSAAVAPTDSVRFNVDHEASRWAGSPVEGPQEGGTILYGGSGVINRSTRLRWTAHLSAT